MNGRFLLVFAVALTVSVPASAALTRAERTIVATIDSEQQRTTALLQRWVDQNSGTMNKAGVEAVRDMVEPEFKQLGFTTQRIDMGAAGRAGHLVARHAEAGAASAFSSSRIWIRCSSRIRHSSGGRRTAIAPTARAPETTRAESPSSSPRSGQCRQQGR